VVGAGQAVTSVSVSARGCPSRLDRRRSSRQRRVVSAGCQAQVGATRFRRSRLGIGAQLPRLQPQRRRRDLHRLGIEVDAVQVVLEDRSTMAWSVHAASTSRPRWRGLLAVERQQQLERHHQEVPRAARRVEQLELAHAGAGAEAHRVVGDGLRHVVGPAALRVGAAAASACELQPRPHPGRSRCARHPMRRSRAAPAPRRLSASGSSRASCTWPATWGRGCSAAASRPCSAR
jgi:hypothetical protein